LWSLGDDNDDDDDGRGSNPDKRKVLPLNNVRDSTDKS
jgi:hypothetical protein